MTISMQIAQARRDAGLTQRDLALRSRLSIQHIRFIEQGRRNPSQQAVTKLKRALKADIMASSARDFYSNDETRQLIEMNRAGHSAAEIATALDRSVTGVYTKLARLRRDGKATYFYPKFCTVAGCTEKHYCRKMCLSHYLKAKRRRII